MRKIKSLSLFFVNILLVLGIFICPNMVTGQESTDSTLFYYKSIFSQRSGKHIESAIDFFEKRSLIYETNKDTISIARVKSYIANAQFLVGSKFDSEKSAIEALSLLDNVAEDSITKAYKKGLSNHLGRLYNKLSAYDKALAYYNKAFSLNESPTDSIIILNNIATIYISQSKFDKASAILNPIYNKLVPINNRDKSIALDNLGFSQSKLNMPDALSKMEMSLGFNLKLGDNYNLFSNYRHLSYYYLDRYDRKTAETYIKKTSEIADIIKDPKYKLEAISLNILFENNTEAQIYKKLSDSIQLIKQQEENKYIAAKYEYAQFEKQAKESELEAVKSKTQKTISNIIAVMIGLLAIFFSSFLIRKHKKEKIKEVIRETFHTERRLSKKVHDELANDMSDTLNYVDNHPEIPSDVKMELANKIDNIYDRTRDISAEIGGFDSKDFAKSLKFLITQHKTEKVKVITNVMSGINWDKISEHKKINIYRSLQELLVNMKKHSQATSIAVIFKSEGRKHFINYTDNGVGFEIEDVHIRGLQNVETRIKSIEGSTTFITSKGNGFKAHLYFLN